MRILVLKTDGPVTFLAVYSDMNLLAEKSWESGRDLAKDLLLQIQDVLHEAGLKISDLQGIVCFAGPGSFTSLRIGVTTANTIAYANSIAIVATSGDEWLSQGINSLLSGHNDKVVAPLYGSDPHITQAKK